MIFALFMLFMINGCFHVTTVDAIKCSFKTGTLIENGTQLEDGRILKDDTTYTSENYIQVNGVKVGCICNIKVCIKKCCPIGEYMLNKTCVPTGMPFEIPRSIRPNIDSYHLIFGNECGKRFKRSLLDPTFVEEDKFVLLKDEKLLITSNKQIIKLKHYCVDYIEDLDDVKALVCERRNTISDSNLIGMIISMPFLLVTFLVYLIIPDKNLHAKSLTCYVLSLFGAYLLIIIVQLYPDYIEFGKCKIVGLFAYFFFMGSFFWMNVMSIDLYWTFSGLRIYARLKDSSEQKRFLLYSCYAWGVALLFVAVISIINENESISSDAWYNPGIGDNRCWFRDEFANLLYFYGPMAIIIMANITLFCITAYNIKKVQQDSLRLRKSSYERDKKKFNLFFKLMLAMGVNWSLEIVSWAGSWQFENMPSAVWYLTDFCNAVYGILIFFIFVFKKRIWTLLLKRYYTVIGKPHLISRQKAQSQNQDLAKTAVVHFTNNNNAAASGSQ